LSREKEESRNQKVLKRFCKRLIPGLCLLQAKPITGGEIRRFGRKDKFVLYPRQDRFIIFLKFLSG